MNQTNNTNLKSYYNENLALLMEFESLPKINRSESIFDIAGYPHYENVASNILAFFINPNNEHGLSQLMLSSLLHLAAGDETEQTNVQVSRETYTLGGGRLDILVETDNQLIGIENKIYHHLSNDLEDYGHSLHEWAKGNQLSVVKIILGLKKQHESFGFTSITYSDFFSVVKARLGNYVTTSSQKWLLYLIDFINTLERLNGDAMEFADNDKFFIENEDRVNSLLGARNKFLSKLNAKVRQLSEEIEQPELCDKQWIYAKFCLVHDFNLSGNLIAFDLYATTKGWIFKLFGRNQLSKSYAARLVSARSEKFVIEQGKFVVAIWPLSTEPNAIKEKVCEWMDWLVEEHNRMAFNSNSIQ